MTDENIKINIDLKKFAVFVVVAMLLVFFLLPNQVLVAYANPDYGQKQIAEIKDTISLANSFALLSNIFSDALSQQIPATGYAIADVYANTTGDAITDAELKKCSECAGNNYFSICLEDGKYICSNQRGQCLPGYTKKDCLNLVSIITSDNNQSCETECSQGTVYPKIYTSACINADKKLTKDDPEIYSILKNSTGLVSDINGPLGKMSCVSGNCYCIGFEANMTPTEDPFKDSTKLKTPTAPGTGKLPYGKTGELQYVPKKQANLIDCSKADDYSFDLKLQPELAEANSLITVSGNVEKTSSVCEGVKYNCRFTYDASCKAVEKKWETCVECNGCKSGYKSIDCHGEKCKSMMGGAILGMILKIIIAIIIIIILVIIAAVVCVVSAGTLCAPATYLAANLGGIILGVVIGGLVGGGVGGAVGGAKGMDTGTDIGIAVGGVVGGGISGAGMTTYTPVIATTADGATYIIIETGTNLIPGLIAGTVAGTLGALGAEFLVPDKDFKKPPCYSICARDYESECSAEPACKKGGYVNQSTDCTYGCDPAPCGAAANKAVKIEIYNSKKQPIKEDSITTDANGNIDYTFTAPNYADSFTAKIIVMKYVK